MSKGKIGNRCPRHVLEHGNQGVFVDPNGPHESAGRIRLSAIDGYHVTTECEAAPYHTLPGWPHVCKHCGAVYWVG